MNNIQILEPNEVFNRNSDIADNELTTFNSPNYNSTLTNSSYLFESKDISSNYNKKQIMKGNDSFSISEFTSTYTKKTITKNISTLTQQLSNSDLTNMNQLYSNQKQLALPYNQTNQVIAPLFLGSDFNNTTNNINHKFNNYIL